MKLWDGQKEYRPRREEAWGSKSFHINGKWRTRSQSSAWVWKESPEGDEIELWLSVTESRQLRLESWLWTVFIWVTWHKSLSLSGQQFSVKYLLNGDNTLIYCIRLWWIHTCCLELLNLTVNSWENNVRKQKRQRVPGTTPRGGCCSVSIGLTTRWKSDEGRRKLDASLNTVPSSRKTNWVSWADHIRKITWFASKPLSHGHESK